MLITVLGLALLIFLGAGLKCTKWIFGLLFFIAVITIFCLNLPTQFIIMPNNSNSEIIKYLAITISYNKSMDFARDQPLIRSFSTHIRFLQLALQTLICQFIWRLGNESCSSLMSSVGQPLSVVLLLFNATALGFLRCSKLYSKKLFIIGFVGNLIICAILMVVGLLAMGEANSCANNKILHRFVGLEALITVILAVQTLYTKYDFAIRYTNAPGNLVWVFLFFSFSWSGHFKTFYIPIGVIYLIITVSNLSVNLVFMMSNFNANIKRIIFFVWFGSLILMVIAEVLGFLAYVGGTDEGAIDVVAKKLAQTFLIINILDAIFWIFAFFSLRIQIGDSIHEEALGLKQREERTQFC